MPRPAPGSSSLSSENRRKNKVATLVELSSYAISLFSPLFCVYFLRILNLINYYSLKIITIKSGQIKIIHICLSVATLFLHEKFNLNIYNCLNNFYCSSLPAMQPIRKDVSFLERNRAMWYLKPSTRVWRPVKHQKYNTYSIYWFRLAPGIN